MVDRLLEPGGVDLPTQPNRKQRGLGLRWVKLTKVNCLLLGR